MPACRPLAALALGSLAAALAIGSATAHRNPAVATYRPMQGESMKLTCGADAETMLVEQARTVRS